MLAPERFTQHPLKKILRLRNISYVAYQLARRKMQSKFNWQPTIQQTKLNKIWQQVDNPAISSLAHLSEDINDPVGTDFYMSLAGERIAYCHGSHLNELYSSPPAAARSLITLGSDDSFDTEKVAALDGKFNRVFSVNATAHADWLTCLPIGLEANGHCAFNKFEIVQECRALHRQPSHLLYGNFSLWTNRYRRYRCLSAFEHKDYFTNRVSYAITPVHDLTQEEYRAFCMEILDHVFVACPAGNGLDTHRMWETLYLGRIPVVLHNPVTDAFPSLPVLRLKSWGDFESTCIPYLMTLHIKQKDLETLTQSYWRKQILSPCL